MHLQSMRTYLEKRTCCPPQIQIPPSALLKWIVVIPCCNEKDLFVTLESLENCEPPSEEGEVIVVINHSKTATESIQKQNKETLKEGLAWKKEAPFLRKHVHFLFFPDLPDKHAGVGLARKIGLDEALSRFERIQEPQGVLISLDADCTVEKNYLQSITKYFLHHPEIKSGTVFYEHPLHALPDESKKAITQYELHLRYYARALFIAGLESFHYQTVGSTMLIKAHTYAKIGGMNKRKAGEDFYFLQKAMNEGHYFEIPHTTVFPSARESDRVPFGTGRAVGQILLQKKDLETYSPQIFRDSQILFRSKEALFYSFEATQRSLQKQFPLLFQFCEESNTWEDLRKIKATTTSLASFWKRLTAYLDAFWMMKWIHFARDQGYSNVSVLEATNHLFHSNHWISQPWENEEEALLSIRQHDRRLAMNQYGSLLE